MLRRSVSAGEKSVVVVLVPTALVVVTSAGVVTEARPSALAVSHPDTGGVARIATPQAGRGDRQDGEARDEVARLHRHRIPL